MGSVRCVYALSWTAGADNMPPASTYEDVHVYAYGDGDENDHGWGCSYRNVQTILGASGKTPPKLSSMVEVQKSHLKEFGYVGNFLPSKYVHCLLVKRAESFIGRWIEPHQAGCYLEQEFGLQTSEALFAPHGSSIRQCLRHTEPAVYETEGNYKINTT